MMKITLIGLMATAAMALCISSAAYAENSAPPASPSDKWLPTVELEGRFNSDRSLAYPKLLIPLAQDEESMLFTDIRTRVDDHDSEEYNIGLGYRRIYGNWILGGYGFVDYLHSASDNGYWQGTVGLEALSESWDVRVNGYLPESTEHSMGGGGVSGTSTALTIGGGGNFGLTTTTTSGGGTVERALPGFDAEVGYKLPIEVADVRVFGGAYHFDADDFDNVSGPKARLELTLGHDHLDFIPDGVEFTAGVQYQNDGPREGTTTALAQVRIPFNFDGKTSSRSKLSPLEKRMTNFIERDVDIVTQEGSAGPVTTTATTEAAQVTINGQNYTGIADTVDANTADINAALTAAGNNALVIVDGTAGVIPATVAITPLQGQALIGGGSTIAATGLTSGTTLSGALPGARPTLRETGGPLGDLITVQQNNVSLRGLELDTNGNFDNGVYVTAQDISLQDLTVRNAGYGLSIESTGDVNIQNTFVTGSGTGIALVAGTVTISDSTVDQNDTGVWVLGLSPLDATLDNVSVTNSVVEGFSLGNGQLSGNATTSGNALDCNSGGWAGTGSITLNGGPTICP